MTCDKCGNKDAYQSIMNNKWLCPNDKCKNYSSALITKASPPTTIAPNPVSKTVPKSTQLIKSQQSTAMDILTSLKTYNIPALCAGGAPRNWKAGIPARDLDIYFFYSDADKYDQKVLSTNIGLFLRSFPAFKKRKQGLDDYDAMPIKHLWEANINGTEIQLILLNDHYFMYDPTLSRSEQLRQSIFDIYDFDICCCTFDSKGILFVSEEAKEDFDNKSLTVSISKLQDIDKLDKLPERSKKLQSYFPDYKLIIDP